MPSVDARVRRSGFPALLAWALFSALLATLGLMLPLYWVYLLSTVAIGALTARSVGVVTNQAGLITLCQMSFAAIGGWIVSWLALARPELPFLLFVLAAGAVTAPIGFVLGLATARIRGVEFAAVTLGFAAALDLVLRQGAFPGVGSGTAVIPAGPFDDPRWFFFLAWVLVLVLQLGLAAFGRSRLGLAWAAVRAGERAAAAAGVRVGAAKANAFAAGALLAGMAGGMLAGQYGLLTTAVFTPLTSMVLFATAVLCGASLFSGAVLAGVFSAFVPELLRRVGLPLDVGNALLAIGAFDVLRRGNGGIAEQLRVRMQERRFRGVRVGCGLPVACLDRAAEPRQAPTPGTVLEISDLTVSYGGIPILEGVDLSVGEMEVHALIGPNGAGKTTLVDAITGFLPGYGGEVRLAGESVDRLPAHLRARRGMRRTFQRTRVVDSLAVDQYLRLTGGTVETIPAVRELLGLPDGDVPIRLMDAGSCRVLEMAAALASGPRILILDEPAAGLGETESRALAERVRRIPGEFGCGVLLIEHDMRFVRASANRITVLEEGRRIASGQVPEVLEDPRVIAAYLGREARA